VRAMAESLGITPSQLAIAWVLHKRPDVVPIPGTKRLAYLARTSGPSTSS